MKIVTLAAAAERLGWDFSTKRNCSRPGGLPTAGSSTAICRRRLRRSEHRHGGRRGRSPVPTTGRRSAAAAGVRTVIRPRHRRRQRASTTTNCGLWWSGGTTSPDDYAAGASALQFNENAVRLSVAPGAQGRGFRSRSPLTPTGQRPDRRQRGDDRCRPARAPRVAAQRLPGSDRLVLRGSIPWGARPSTRLVSVDNPTVFFVSASAQRADRARHRRARTCRGHRRDSGCPGKRQGDEPIASQRSAPLPQLAVAPDENQPEPARGNVLKSLGAADGVRLRSSRWRDSGADYAAGMG